MKITVIKPPSNTRRIYPALGLGYIASVLKHNNYDVEFIDTCLVDFPLDKIKGNPEAYWGTSYPLEWGLIERYFKERNREIDIALIGGSFTADINNSFRIANILKRINRRCITVLGGTHASALTKQSMEDCQNIDYIVRGEGEYIVLDLVKALLTGNDINKIKGLSYRKSDGDIYVSEKSSLIMDLDCLPFPERELMPMEQYRNIWKEFLLGSIPQIESDPAGLIFSSRGCFGKCIFCASNEISRRKMRLRTAKNVIDEINYLIKKYSIKNITFMDDTFTVNKKRCIEICDYLAKTNLPWYCWTRIDTISTDLLAIMKKSGCKLLNFGLESGDNYILNIMKKGITLKQIEDGLKIVNKSGIKYVASFTIGHPGETKETIRKTVNMAKNFGGLGAGVYRITPYPGTPLYEDAIKNNWIKKVAWDLYDDTSEAEPFYIPPGWTMEEFHRACLSAQKEVANYYQTKKLFTLTFVFKRILRIKSFIELKNLIFNNIWILYKVVLTKIKSNYKSI